MKRPSRFLCVLLVLAALCLLAAPAAGAAEFTLSPVGNLTISTGKKARQLVLDWDAVEGARAYQVLRSTTGKTGSFQSIIVQPDPGYTDTGLKNGKTYYYAVRALRWDGTDLVCGPYRKISLSTRITKSDAVKRFAQTYKAMNKFVRIRDWDARIPTADGMGAYYPLALGGCSTKADVKAWLCKYFQKKAANAIIRYYRLKEIDGKPCIYRPDADGVGALAVNDVTARKLKYADKKVACFFDTYEIVGPEDDVVPMPTLRLTLVYESGRWVFTDDDYWHQLNFYYTSMVKPAVG